MNIVIAILVFSLLILFHELGHFSLAKLNGIRVNEFCLGLGPTIIGFTKGETKYSLKALPFGGACMMEGEDENSDDERAFNKKGVWARISVVAAGPIFNFIMAFVFSVFLIGNVGIDKPVLTDVIEGYAAEEAVLVNSNELSEYLNMKEAIYHTLTLFEHRCRFGKKYGSAEEGQKMSVRQDVINLLWEFSECLKFRQYSRASELLLAAENKMIEYPAPSLLTEGIFHIINIISENDKKINAAAEYEKLKDSFDLDHIFRVLREYVGAMQDQEKDNSNYYIDRIKEYIGINYHEALTVQNLSDYVHLSPNYLGKMFYLHTGEYLKDYINTVRMENAGRLLLTRQYQVSEVAEMVGIADQRYFSRVFKKTFGCSPTEYIFRKEELNNSHGVE